MWAVNAPVSSSCGTHDCIDATVGAPLAPALQHRSYGYPSSCTSLKNVTLLVLFYSPSKAGNEQDVLHPGHKHPGHKPPGPEQDMLHSARYASLRYASLKICFTQLMTAGSSVVVMSVMVRWDAHAPALWWRCAPRRREWNGPHGTAPSQRGPGHRGRVRVRVRVTGRVMVRVRVSLPNEVLDAGLGLGLGLGLGSGLAFPTRFWVRDRVRVRIRLRIRVRRSLRV